MMRPYSGEEAFLEILPFLPPKASSILEIGPGSGHFAALLAKHYPGCAIHLIDGDRSAPDARKTGYSNEIVPWNDVIHAVEHVRSEVPGAEVFGYTPDKIPHTIPCDIVVSLWSCGFHYPVETYLPLVKNSLSSDRLAIFDHRTPLKDVLVVMLESFELIGCAANDDKRQCLVWKKK